MPLRDDLLNSIPGENPSGESLRYAPVYDKIKEARREDDDAPQGDWQRERKTADYPLVIKLASEAIATKSKDIQLAVWLAEALLKREGFSGFRSGLDLIRGLLESFWDTVLPELEDGDAELRAVPLDWLGGRMDAALRSVALTRNGLSWFKYKESRSVGHEEDAAESEQKQEARAAAIADGKLTGEEWDAGFNSTSKAYYVNLEQELDAILESIESLDSFCQEKFGDVAPSFRPLRDTVQDIRHTAHLLLQKKRETEPDEEAAPEEAEEPAAESAEGTPSRDEPEPVAAVVRPKPRKGPQTAEPSDKDDAFERVIAIAAYLRREDPYSPGPFLLLRGLRWGELRSAGTSVDSSLLEPPPTEIRQSLKRCAAEYDWQQVLELAETAAGMPCGRGWLDGQRYAVRAATELGYEQIATAIRRELNGLLADYPDLPGSVLLDDTPTANAETQAWLKEIAPAAPAVDVAPAYIEAPVEDEVVTEDGGGPEAPPDANDLALQAANSGRHEEAIEILTREAVIEKSGRGRFQRRVQLAQLCMCMGYDRIALPMLEQLANEIDSRCLEGWESPAMVAHPLTLFYRCLEKMEANPELKQKIYDRICRLDPVQALSCSR